MIIPAYIVSIATNCAGYYSKNWPPYYAIAIFAVFCWIALRIWKTPPGTPILDHVSASAPFAAFLALPLFLMLISDRLFLRSDWTNLTLDLILFCTGVLIAADSRNRAGIVYGSLSTVVICTGLNVYELLVYPNAWSTAPGRSAGWLENPNDSAAVISLCSTLYFGTRMVSLKRWDYLVLGASFIGVAATFSRSGFLLYCFPLLAAGVAQGKDGRVLGKIIKTLAVLAFGIFALGYGASSLDLSQDAQTRLDWLLMKSTSDTSVEARVIRAEQYWYGFLESPVTGAGVLTSLQVTEGPHNMFVAIAFDLGIFGLSAYVLLLLLLLQRAVRLTQEGAREGYLVLFTTGWLIIYSFFSHNIMSDQAELLGLGLALFAAVPSISSAQSTS